MAPQSFAAADETTSKKKLTLASLIGDRIVAHDNRFLGGFIDDLFDPCSLLNEFSHYRSDFHNHSLFNEFGTYGDDFSELSAYNDTAEHPPRIIGPKNRFRMWISINPNFKPRLDPHVLREWLEAFDRASRQESSPKP